MAKVAKDPDLAQYQGNSGLASRWLKEMELVEQSADQQLFEKQGLEIQRKYKNASLTADYNNPESRSRVTFNVLWSNCQVLEPALFARLPKIYCERLTENSDPIGKYAAKIAERCVSFNQTSQYDQRVYNISMCVQDRLLPGRGQGWLVLKADYEDDTDDEGNAIVDKDGNAVKRVKPNSERVEFLHLNFCDYLESKARTQYEVRWRTRVMYMTYEEAVDEFGEDKAKGLNFSANPYDKKRNKDDNDPDFLRQAKIYQIYDLTSKEVIFVAKGSDEPLKRTKDPMKIKDFWCCPIPLLATCTSDSTYPTPDYMIYKSLAEELNFVCERLNGMTDCVRLVGMVASQHNKDIKEMLRLNDGDLKSMPNWQQFADKGGLSAMVNWLPFENAVAAIPVLEERFRSIKSQIDEITSMPDIVRGSSDPNDPVYTQQQKSHWTVIKLIKKQQDVQRFCREIARKDAEIIFEFFSDETIWMMSGAEFDKPEEQAMFQPALQLLRDDRLRTFRVDIETDSTIAIDEAQAMESWAKYLEGMNFIFSNVQSVMQFRPELMKPMLESAMGAIRTLRTGRSIEGAWEKALEEIEAADREARENPPDVPPDPQIMRAQNEQQKIMQDGQKDQAELQLKYQEFDFNTYLENQKLQLDSMKIEGELFLKSEANQIDAGEQLTRSQIDKLLADMDIFQAELKNKLEAEKIAIQAALDSDRLEFDKKARILEVQEKIMEEKRLAGDQMLEHKRMLLEHKEAMSKEKAEAGEKNKDKEPKMPVINVHVGGGKKRIKKTADGYESSDVEEATP